MRLDVRWRRSNVGHLRSTDDSFAFAYDEAWTARNDASPISLSLPLRVEEYVGGAAHNFFANLLPEGAAREAVCRRLGISVGNDLALLAAIGGECAGALSVVATDAPVSDDDHAYERIDKRRLQRLVEHDTVVPLLVGGPTTRLSLAGAQDKLPVAVLDGDIQLPLRGAPSTHILKLPNARYPHLPVNEAFVMGLAQRIALDVPTVELVTRTRPACLLVTRYDRRSSDDEWPVERLHQEDLCQALGLPSIRKYEQEGGPSLAAVIDVVRRHVRNPLRDVVRVLEWQAFNVVVGNADGHAKNLAFLYDEPGPPRLAPFYDLVSTQQYRGLSRSLAMTVGERAKPTELHRAQWTALAQAVAIRPLTVIDTVGGVAERVLAAVDPWRADFKERYGAQPVLETLPRAIKANARRILRSLVTA